tara:strand:- start:19 stop:417 length:399 start_codon:yes stop_codon:yes gene_type:complete
MKNIILSLFLLFILTSCATIINDPTVPVTLSFSDGSSGICNVSNKRISHQLKIPGTHNIRRSDDALVFDCETDDGRKAYGNVPSEMEGAKLGASIFFFDLGITDSITDKHRTYTSSFVIPIQPKKEEKKYGF